MEYDVIIIGAGLAGLMAAEGASSRGARVLILAKGMGSLPLTSGCIDGLGYFAGPAGPSGAPLASPLSALPGLRDKNPQHPYAKLKTELLVESLSRFQEVVEGGGMPYSGNFDSNLFLATAIGTIHPTCLAPVIMKEGNLSNPGPVLLLGFQGLKDFNAFWAAENLNSLHSRERISCSFRPVILDGLDLSGIAVNAVNLARGFDDPLFRDRFARKVRPILHPGERIAVPAVLGFHSAQETWLDLRDKLGVEIFEIPLPPPSVPGIRLYNLMRAHLQKKGVRVLIGLSSLKPMFAGDRVAGFMLGERESPHYSGRGFVLASGSFIGGGLDSDRSAVRETVFDLPVNYRQHRREWFNRNLLSPEGQPFNRFGLEVNDSLNPVDANGRVIYNNLFAAGAILAHADPMVEKSGGGIAVATGYQAGINAAAVK